MRGSFFIKPFEFIVEVNGESWEQGANIAGECTVKPMGDTTNLEQVGVFLALVDIKKYKKADPTALEIIDETIFEDVSKESSFPIEFSLPENAYLTDSGKSFYLLCGEKSKLVSSGALQLNVVPKKVITDFVKVFESFFRFKTKTIKSKKDQIDFKMIGPGTGDLAPVEQLNLLVKSNQTDLELTYNFKVKKLSYEGGAVNAVSVKMPLKQTVGEKEYSMFGGAFNQDGVIKAITETLDQVKRKTTY